MSERTKDYLVFLMAVSSPVAIALGIVTVMSGMVLGFFFLGYGVTTIWSCSRLLWEMYRHGIHNDHFCGGADCHGYRGPY